MARLICIFQICDCKRLKYFMINSFCSFQNSCVYTMYFYYINYLFESRPLNRSKWLADLKIVIEFVTKTIILLDTSTVHLHLIFYSFLLVYFIIIFFCWGEHGPGPLQGVHGPGPYKWAMDPVQNGGSMNSWSMFCPHFLGIKGFNLNS